MVITPDIALSVVIFEGKEMRLSDYQGMLLCNVLYDSSSVVNAQMGGLNSKQRLELYNDIMTQQNHTIVDLDKNEPEEATTDSPVSPDGS